MTKKPKFIILLYHKIGKYSETSRFPGLYVTEDNFDRQIKYLKNKGYNFITLSELKALYDYFYSDTAKDKPDITGIKAGNILNGSLKFVALTFDDGSKSLYAKGLGVMSDNNVRGTVFMVSGLIGGMNEWDIKNGEQADEMLNLDELKTMVDYGIEIGAHTVTHPHLTEISADESFSEMKSSKSELEKLLKTDINFFAYPYGDYNEEVKELAKKAGFSGACITRTGIVKNNSDFFALKRVAIRHNTDFFKFKRKIFKVRLFY